MFSKKGTVAFLYLIFAGIFSFLFGFCPLAQAEETILDFKSDIIVQKDASMNVIETIKVRAEGDKIKRGIYREFPTRYKDDYGNNYTVGFEVVRVLRDGSTEPYHIDDVKNGKRVYIGREDFFLPAGEYTYTIEYKTDRQLGIFADHDELYWNVTGNGWEFPIKRASASVLIPGEASKHIGYVTCYTGPKGAKGKNCEMFLNFFDTMEFSTTRPLQINEGITIVVSWSKGFITEPDFRKKVTYFFSDNRGTLIGILSLALIFGYYLIVWIRAGRDPKGDTIVVRYTPPDNMTPAVMRYITNMGYDDKTFAAAVIDMAVKGHIKISEEQGKYTIQKKDGRTPLSTEEEKIIKKLLSSSSEITFEQKNHEKIHGAIDSIKNYLAMNFEKRYFIKNTGYFVIGLLLTMVMLGLSGFSTAKANGQPGEFVFISIWLTIWSAGVTVLIVAVISSWKKAIIARFKKPAYAVGAVLITLFSLPFFAGEILGLILLKSATSIFMIPFLIVLIGINYLFYHLLKAPTRAGRKLLDVIEGFKRFLVATEKDRIQMMSLPDRTPELFEKYLPYALALDVEEAWSEQFSDVLAAAAAGRPEGGYSSSWVSTTSFSSIASGTFASSLGSSFSDAISSSSSAPGSSSGSGGGGSSGGGGGGGGGGGW